jgi:predicted GNAT superfamily acetyltransferase
MILTQAVQTHFAEILALNEGSVHFLSPLSAQRLEQLHQLAVHHKVLLEGERVAAFLLAFAPGSSYDSINYQWFEARLTRFLYIDRVVVSPDFRGRGLASRLYQDLFEHARQRGMSQVVCEFDIDPPNPASEAFHRRFGFSQLGTQAVASKWVSLQGAPLVPVTSR